MNPSPYPPSSAHPLPAFWIIPPMTGATKTRASPTAPLLTLIASRWLSTRVIRGLRRTQAPTSLAQRRSLSMTTTPFITTDHREGQVTMTDFLEHQLWCHGLQILECLAWDWQWGFDGYIMSDGDVVSLAYDEQGCVKSPEDAEGSGMSFHVFKFGFEFWLW